MYSKIEEYTVKDVEGVGFEVKGRWQDDIHDLELRLVLDVHFFSIVEAELTPIRVPHELCHQGIRSLERLKGMVIGPGFSKQVNRALVGPNGCYHAAEMVVNGFKAIVQSGSRRRPDWMDEELYASRWQEWVDKYKDICVYFAQPNVSKEEIERSILNKTEA